MTLTYHTRGNDAPKGKHYLFVHAAAEDKAAQERLVKMVLDTKDGKNYAVWCSDDPVAVFGELGSGDLGAMSVFIVLVSPEYLQLCERHAPVDSSGSTFIDLLARQGVAVLPVFTSAAAIAPFNRLFGDLHGISLTLPEAPRLLEEQLRSFLPDDDLRELILSEAFDGRLFLSYRKKDKEHIQRIMAAIHDTDAAGSASIWFDEFLVAGREFNDEIRSKLTESDAMVLVVTPSLLEPTNYVHDVEYRIAHDELGKTVIPVEAAKTDDRQLRAAYDGLGMSVPTDNASKLNRLLRQAGLGTRPRTPFATYLLGMAFFVGFMVERDGQRALSLFQEAAVHGCEEALEQLGFMYTAGLVVERDHNRAVDYKSRAFDLQRVRPVIEVGDVLKRSYRLLYGTDGLCLMLKTLGRPEEARDIDTAFLKVLRLAYSTSERDRVLYEAEALIDLADTHYDVQPSTERLEQAITYANKALKALSKVPADTELSYLKAIAQSVMGGCLAKAGRLDEAIASYEEAEKGMELLAQENPDLEYKSKSASMSLNLAMLYRERAMGQMAKKPSQSIKFMQPALDKMGVAIEKARQVVEIDPTINNRETLVLALLDSGISAVKKRDAVAQLKEARDLALQLQEETGDGSFDATVRDVKAALRKRQGFFGRLFG